jgi:hypothetical protein
MWWQLDRAPAEHAQTESVPSVLVRRWVSFPQGQAPAVAELRASACAISLCLEWQPPSSTRRPAGPQLEPIVQYTVSSLITLPPPSMLATSNGACWPAAWMPWYLSPSLGILRPCRTDVMRDRRSCQTDERRHNPPALALIASAQHAPHRQPLTGCRTTSARQRQNDVRGLSDCTASRLIGAAASHGKAHSLTRAAALRLCARWRGPATPLAALRSRGAAAAGPVPGRGCPACISPVTRPRRSPATRPRRRASAALAHRRAARSVRADLMILILLL